MQDAGLGPRLRHERERRKISLERVAEETKINIGLLRDLERDQISRWPTGIFRRSFIRAYAAAIGLDPDQTVDEFVACYPDPPQANVPFDSVPQSRLSTVGAIARIAKPDALLHRSSHAMRLIMQDEPQPFVGGRLLNRIPRRLAAAFWDVGSAVLLALLVYAWLDRFWIPFAVILACYHAGSVIALGNTPGVYFFAPTQVTGRGDPTSSSSDDMSEVPMFNPRSV